MSDSDSKSKLRGRGAVWLVVGALLLGGGWYFFFNESTPLVNAAMAGPAGKNGSKKRAATKPADESEEASTTKKTAPGAKTASAAGAKNPAAAIAAHAARAAALMANLGPEYHDTTSGFSVRFPQDWRIRTFGGKTWILDCGDPSTGMISVGFSSCPRTMTVDHLSPETIARRILRHPDTTLQSQGRAVIAGHEAIWSKFTGPLAMTNGSPRMTRVHYLIPLEDGRALELRAAAPPSKFEQVAPLMKAALETFALERGSR